MSFFGHQNSSGESPDDIPVGERDLKQAAIVLVRWEQAVGDTDAAMRAAVLAIAEAGGYTSLESQIRNPDSMDRPWRWLIAVARRARRDGQLLLAARVCFFPLFWSQVMMPRLQLGDFVDMGLADIPKPLLRDVAVAALACLDELPVDQVIIGNQTGVFRTVEARKFASLKIRELHSDGAIIEAPVVARAQEILSE